MKIAISLPREEFLLIEKLKTKLKKSRSQLIQEAIEYWLEGRQRQGLIEKYEKGYRAKPEKLSHIAALEKAQLSSFSEEGWS